MYRRMPGILTALLVVGCGAFVGCGRSGGRETSDVSGTITLGGKPLVGAKISFQSIDNFVGYGKTDEQGNYRLVQGAVQGPNKVFISKIEGGELPDNFNPDPEAGMDMGQMEAAAAAQSKGRGAKGPQLPKETVPAEFSDPAKSTLKWDVTAGSNEKVNFNL